MLQEERSWLDVLLKGRVFHPAFFWDCVKWIINCVVKSALYTHPNLPAAPHRQSIYCRWWISPQSEALRCEKTTSATTFIHSVVCVRIQHCLLGPFVAMTQHGRLIHTPFLKRSSWQKTRILSPKPLFLQPCTPETVVPIMFGTLFAPSTGFEGGSTIIEK